jgi:glycosyltransferase involved in cell wall biosynthesis
VNQDHNGGTPERPAILQIIPRLDTGGAERTTLDVAKAITHAGYRSLVVSEGGRYEDELRDAGAILIRLPVGSKNPLTIYANSLRLARIFREHKVALIHARSRAPAWSALLAARRMRIPFVTTYHGIYNAKGALKRFYNSVMARGDAVIANSAWTARYIEQQHGKLAKPPIVIPRGLDLKAFNPDTVAAERTAGLGNAWGVPEGARVLLLPGRLTRWKGQLVLIEALARLKREGRLPKMHAVLAGDAQGRDAYTSELDDAVAAAGLGDMLVCPGHVTDMPAAYLASDIIVSASTDPEAFGRVAAEASAMRRPVIATAHGGAMETVLDGESGILVPPNDAAALADAIAALLAASPARLAEMGERGRAYVTERFSTESMCAATLEVYRSLLPKVGS